MKQDRVNTKVVPDTRREMNDGRFPLKLRVTYKGNRKYYGTGYSATVEEWAVINSDKAKGKLRSVKNAIAAIENDCQKCADEIIPFSFKQLEKLFFESRIGFENLKSAFDNYIATLRKNDQVGTAVAYQTAYNKLHKFRPDLKIEHVTIEFLQDFERWMLKDGNSATSVGIYLRALRSIMNIAVENHIVKREDYPFGKRKYVIPTGDNTKKALNLDAIEAVFNYQVEAGSSFDKAKGFWIFSYLCNGMNMADIAYLRWNNLHASTLTFTREKTKRTIRDKPKKITVIRNEMINQIIENWGNMYAGEPMDYIFNIVDKHDSPTVARKKIQQFTKVTNTWMKRMGDDLGFDLKLTTYVARHSYATILIRSGAPLKLASDNLGHQSMVTTEKYFAGFDIQTQEKYAKVLINFKKKSLKRSQ